MALTESQRVILAADIRGSSDPDVVAALAIRNDTELTRLYNLDSSPNFFVWRESIEPDEYREALDWTEVDNLTAGKARIWEWITQNMTFSIDATKTNVRAGLGNAFQTSNSSKAGLLAIAKAVASRAEALFATGDGSSGSPGVRSFIGKITTLDVGLALNENP